MHKKWIGVIILSFLLLTGCTQQAEDVALNEGISIKETCTHITNKIANEAFAEIQELILAPQEGIYRIENFAMKVLSEEEKEDGKIWAKVAVTSDWTLTQKPEEYPLIVGMLEAKAELTDEEDVKKADEIIDGWLVEFEANYLVTEENRQEVYIVFKPGSQEYELFYHYRYEDTDEMVLLKEFSEENWGQDAEFLKMIGKERLKNDLNY